MHNYSVRLATLSDADEAMKCVILSRKFMASNGNPYQWNDSYPSKELILQDVEKKIGYVILDDKGCVIAYFAFIIGEDPTYKIIDGKWSSNSLYGTVHRIASDCVHKDVAKTCFDYCRTLISYLRCDTHECNQPMRQAMEKYGFNECGIIYLENGDPRVAFDFICR